MFHLEPAGAGLSGGGQGVEGRCTYLLWWHAADCAGEGLTMKNEQLKQAAPARGGYGRPVFSWEKTTQPNGYEWILSYGVLHYAWQSTYPMDCVERYHIAFHLAQARVHLKRQWRKRNPSHA